MAVRNISTRLAVEGESAYKAAIQSCNLELNNLKSALALTESEYKNNANSMDALTSKSTALTNVHNAQKEKVDKLRDALENAQKAKEKYTERVTDAKNNIEKCEAKLEELKNTTGDTTVEQAALTKELEGYKKELAEAEAGQAAAEKACLQWGTQLNKAEIELNNLSDEITTNNKHLDEAANSADGCATSIDEYGKSTETAAESVSNLGAALVAAGIAKLIKEIFDALASCTSASMDFEAAMSVIQATTGATKTEMDEVGVAIRQTALRTGESVHDIANSAKDLMEVNGDVGLALEQLTYGTDLAIATNTDYSKTFDFLSAAMKTFGLDADQTQKTVDSFAYTTVKTNLNLSQLAEAYVNVGGSAVNAGLDIDTVNAALIIMSEAGLKGGAAGTALNGVLKNLSAPTGKAAEELERLGVALYDNNGQSRDMMEVMGELEGVLGSLTDEQKNRSQSIIFDSVALKSWNMLTADGIGEVVALSKEITQSSSAFNGQGQAAGMAGVAMDNTATKIKKMEAAAEDLRISIGDALTPALGKLADAGTEAFTWASEFAQNNPEVIQGLIAIAAGLALLTAGVTAAAAAKKIAAAAQALWNAVMAVNPLVLITMALAALCAGIAIFKAMQSDANEEVKAFTKSLKESKQAHEENIDALNKQADNVTHLAAALETALAAEDKSEAQKRVILGLVEQLNAAMPELALHYDTLTDSVNMSTEAIKAAALAEADRVKNEENIKRLSELYVEQAENTIRLEDAQLRLDEATVAYNENADKQVEVKSAATNATNKYASELQNATAAVNMHANASDELAAEIAELEGSINSVIETQNTHTAALTPAQSAVEKMEDRVSSLIEEMQSLCDAYAESKQAAYESIEKQLGLFKELSGTADRSVTDLIGTLQNQNKFMYDYADNIVWAMENGVDKGLVLKLSDGSEESARILQAIVDDGGQNIDKLNEELARVEEGKNKFSDVVAELQTDFKTKTDEMAKQMAKAVQDMEQSAQARTIGAENIQGLINGAESKRAALIETYTSIANAALAAYKAVMAQMSPSRRMFEAGVNDVTGTILGAESKKDDLRRTYEGLAETAAHAVESATPTMIEPPTSTAQADRQITEIVRAIIPNKETGGFSFVQNIYTQETNYAEQQREATKQFKQAAREVYA